MAKKEKNDLGIETIRANSDDILAEFSMFAAVQLLTDNGKILERRIRALPYGYRDYKLAIKMATRVTEDILMTFPPEKLLGMKQQVRNMFCKVYCGKPVVVDPERLYMDVKDFDVICQAAFEGNCKYCMKDSCDQCELGKMFDRHLVKCRDDSTWSVCGLY